MRTIQIQVDSRTSTYAETRKRVQPYLYSNFELAECGYGWPELIVVHGEDKAGWTAEAQAARMRSGLIAATVVS